MKQLKNDNGIRFRSLNEYIYINGKVNFYHIPDNLIKRYICENGYWISFSTCHCSGVCEIDCCGKNKCSIIEAKDYINFLREERLKRIL